jgi:phospholipid/cholesterol/gamma-HCH transport system permease protein
MKNQGKKHPLKMQKVKNFTAVQTIRLSEKAIKKKQETSSFLKEVGNATLFVLRTFREALLPPYEWREFTRQCFEIGNKSLPLVAITGMIMGLVLTIQSRPIMEDFGAESWLPAMVSVSLIREIGPVITALICAGKVGSGIGAELGSMKVTEQIDAMEVSASNPFKYLVATRVMAVTLMLPLLVFFSDACGLFGSFLGVNIKGDVQFVLYFSRAFSAIKFTDFIPASIKSVFFGMAIGLVGCYKGYHAGRGTESVGKASNSAVVMASVTVFVMDMVAVQITDMLTQRS